MKLNIHIHQLDTQVSVSGQIQAEDCPAIAAAGFRALICNRPDHEAVEQPEVAQIAAAAAALGLPLRHIPVLGSAIGEADILAFQRALDELPGPILCYCRSGNRCTLLWGLARCSEQPVEQLIAQAADAGMDLSGLRARMLQRQQAHSA